MTLSVVVVFLTALGLGLWLPQANLGLRYTAGMIAIPSGMTGLQGAFGLSATQTAWSLALLSGIGATFWLVREGRRIPVARFGRFLRHPVCVCVAVLLALGVNGMLPATAPAPSGPVFANWDDLPRALLPGLVGDGGAATALLPAVALIGLLAEAGRAALRLLRADRAS